MNFISALGLIGPVGTPELIIVLVIIVLLFGAGKLPKLARSIGQSIKEFKSEMKDGEVGAGPADVNASTRFCPKCGTDVKDEEALFCPKCGNKL